MLLENFEFIIIEECLDEEWQIREKYWITYYNSFKGKGYNESEGGDGVPVEHSLSPFIKDIIELLKDYDMDLRDNDENTYPVLYLKYLEQIV